MNPSETFNKRPVRPACVLTYLAGLLLLVLSFATSACSPITRADQPVISQGQLLEGGRTAGQSFFARYGGLESVYFFLSPKLSGEGQIIFHLRSNSHSTHDLSRAILPVQAVISPAFYKFDFAALDDSQFQSYYAYLEIEGEGQVEVGSGPADVYLEGALYEDHRPLEAQAAFHLGYQTGYLVMGLFQLLLQWGRTILLGLFLFILPGWGLLKLLYREWSSLSWPEKMALSGGVSLVVYPILFLWAYLLRLQLGAIFAWLPPLMGLGMILWASRSENLTPTEHLVKLRFQSRSAPSNLAVLHRPTWPQLAFLIIAGLVVLTRFWTVRTLEIPMLGDSYQHTMITQLLVDNRGLFTSWQPYADLNTFTYHFGFHSAAAAYAWLSGQPTPQAVLWTGQLLNILAVLSLYPLAVKLGRSQWAGVAAILLAGLLFPMPMAYTNWGRYTQLAGQVVLPVAIYLLWVLLESKPVQRMAYTLAWITLGGIALIHYRILIFSLLFLPAFFAIYARQLGMKELVRRVTWAGLGAGIIFLPWFLRQFGGTILAIFSSSLSTPASRLPEATQQYNAVGDLSVYLPVWVWIAAVAAVAWGLLRREKPATAVFIWWGLIVLATNPHWIGLPGTGAISNFALAIAAYIPASLLVGAAVGWAIERFNPAQAGSINQPASAPIYRFVGIGIFLVVCGLALWGARGETRYINIPANSLVTRPDLRAAGWIKENIPTEARFLVNSFLAYSGTNVVGSDAGWWLPLLAQRQTTLPPLSYGLEPEPWPGYRREIMDLATVIQEKGLLHPDSLAALRKRNVSHVYIGQQQGRVNYSGAFVLDADELLSSPHFKPVYHEDRVWVFEWVD